MSNDPNENFANAVDKWLFEKLQDQDLEQHLLIARMQKVGCHVRRQFAMPIGDHKVKEKKGLHTTNKSKEHKTLHTPLETMVLILTD